VQQLNVGCAALALIAAGCGAAQVAAECKASDCTPAQNSYAAEVSSVSSVGPPAIEFADLILDNRGGYFAMTMPEPALINGHVLADGQPVSATVVLTRPSRVLGRPDVSYQASVDTAGAFALSVPPNLGTERYTVRVQPTDSTHYAPKTVTLQVSGNTQLDLSLATGDQLALLRGAVKDVLASPVNGARVVLRDAVSLLDVSTSGTTATDGTFVISVPLDVTALSSGLVIAVEIGDTTTGLLSMSVALPTHAVQTQLVDGAMVLQLPSLPAPSHLKLRVVGSGSNGIDQPVIGARVVLRAIVLDNGVLGDTRVVHEVDVQTDSDGQFAADLYSNAAGARQYMLAVSPPTDSDFQTSTSAITVGPSSGVGSTVRLPARPQVSGRVLDPAGMPLKGAVLQPDADTSGTLYSSATTTTSASTAITDADGRFTFRLDAGTYQLGVVPPASSGLPRRWLSSRAIDADVDLGNLVTPTALEFDGVVVDENTMPLRKSDGTPIQSSVHLYLIPPGNAACDPDVPGCLVPPQLQAEGTTDNNGRATLLLAADGT
jgi:hypothetical protein